MNTTLFVMHPLDYYGVWMHTALLPYVQMITNAWNVVQRLMVNTVFGSMHSTEKLGACDVNVVNALT